MPILTRGETRILFIHIPKTGGTYVEDLFRANGFQVHFWQPKRVLPVQSISLQHLHAAPLAMMMDLSAFDYIFTTVRHPFRRLLSEYKMREPEGRIGFGDWASGALSDVAEDPATLDNHMRPQTDFLLPGGRVYRQEDGFDAAFTEKLASEAGVELDIKTVQRRRDNAAWHANTANTLHLGPTERSRFLAYYAPDFERFGYDRDAV